MFGIKPTVKKNENLDSFVKDVTDFQAEHSRVPTVEELHTISGIPVNLADKYVRKDMIHTGAIVGNLEKYIAWGLCLILWENFCGGKWTWDVGMFSM